MSDRIEVVVVGAGQAGLAVSRELTHAGVAHVVLERDLVGQGWRGRWDSFCLVTPNWFLQLPGQTYDGGDPDGFMPRDEVVSYLERYAAGFEAPVREGIDVTSLRPGPDAGFLVETSAGEIVARTVVLSTGAYQRPHRPAGAASLPAGLLQIDLEDYRNPADLPTGPVLLSAAASPAARSPGRRRRPRPLRAGPRRERRVGRSAECAAHGSGPGASRRARPGAAGDPEPEPFNGDGPEELSLRGFGAVVFAGGFRPDYASWVRFPGAFDEFGFPLHEEGASIVAPGLYFVGVHFLRKRKSSLLNGVGEDAGIVARQIAARQVQPAA